MIDSSDQDAIIRQNNDGTSSIWSPINWLHTYVLMELPLRGAQIAYNDSGEADVEIPDINDNGEIYWRCNEGPLAGQTKKQSMIQKDERGGLGYFSTTNKNHTGFSVPWLPEKVAYWLIKLRQWQAKYNPIATPTPWAECKRTHFNITQLTEKGSNCFLFRGYGQVEAIKFQTALANRIATSLYHTQPSGITLATCKTGNVKLPFNYRTPYSPHCLRVGLISAFVLEYGLPIEIVMKIVGHSTILMTIYYCKIGSAELTKRMEEGEKKALKETAYALQRYIEQQKIDAVKNQLVSNSDESLRSLDNTVPSANFTFSDIGICPYANSRCYEGGDENKKLGSYAPVLAGYMGSQNCVRCRFFISGPAYLGGLLSLSNEISLQTRLQALHYSEIEEKIKACDSQSAVLDSEEYDNPLLKFPENADKRNQIAMTKRKLNTNYEQAATKLDMLLCDMQCASRLVNKCIDLLNNQVSTDESNGLMLIKKSTMRMELHMEESSVYQQVTEVCENAEIYDFANADLALLTRTQMLDKIAHSNGIEPFLYRLTEQQQLEVGNQMNRLIQARLGSLDRVTDLVEGTLHLNDLTGGDQSLKNDFERIAQQSTGRLSKL